MQVWLLDNQLGWPVDAMLVPMTDAHVTALNATWVPEFHRRQESSEKDQDFLMWNRGVRYADFLTQREGVRVYVVARNAEVQGVLALQESPEASRVDEEERALLVRYLATAPWNRRGRAKLRRYGRTGTVLLGQAVLDSMAAGCMGRLGLHSLTASDQFYRKIGFSDRGPDPAERGLRYFELAGASAARLLRGSRLLAEPATILPSEPSSTQGTDDSTPDIDPKEQT